MTKFADIYLNQMRLISKAAGTLLSFESKNTIILYHVQQSPVIFRAVIKKDKNDNFRLFITQLPSSIPLKEPLSNKISPAILEQITNKIQSEATMPLVHY